MVNGGRCTTTRRSQCRSKRQRRSARARTEAVLWALYDNIRCPTLVIRGANSDLLSRETLHQMATRGPKAQTSEIPGVGHAPTLMLENEIAVVRQFLLGGAAR